MQHVGRLRQQFRQRLARRRAHDSTQVATAFAELADTANNDAGGSDERSRAHDSATADSRWYRRCLTKVAERLRYATQADFRAANKVDHAGLSGRRAAGKSSQGSCGNGSCAGRNTRRKEADGRKNTGSGRRTGDRIPAPRDDPLCRTATLRHAVASIMLPIVDFYSCTRPADLPRIFAAYRSSIAQQRLPLWSTANSMASTSRHLPAWLRPSPHHGNASAERIELRPNKVKDRGCGFPRRSSISSCGRLWRRTSAHAPEGAVDGIAGLLACNDLKMTSRCCWADRLRSAMRCG